MDYIIYSINIVIIVLLTTCIIITAHLFLHYKLYNPSLQCIIPQAVNTV